MIQCLDFSPQSIEKMINDSQNASPNIGTKIIALVAAVAVAGGLFAGYAMLQKRRQQAEAKTQMSAKSPREVAPIEAQIFADEPYSKNGQAIIGGRVKNLSNRTLQDLSVVLELQSRNGDQTEQRTVALTPASLEPSGEGRYLLKIPTESWKGARLVKLQSAAGAQSSDIAFTTGEGARRPIEQPNMRPRVVVTPRPKPRGEEFINTPDTADRY